MTRKLLLVASAITLVFALSNADVEAQVCLDDYNQRITCGGPTLAYPSGGFSSVAGTTTTPASTTTSTAPAAETSQGLAFTGVESQLLGYVGAGLLGLGGVAIVASRRRESAND